jgi:hypothetical protein
MLQIGGSPGLPDREGARGRGLDPKLSRPFLPLFFFGDIPIAREHDRAVSLFVIPAEAGIHSHGAGGIAARSLPRRARIMIVAQNGS